VIEPYFTLLGKNTSLLHNLSISLKLRIHDVLWSELRKLEEPLLHDFIETVSKETQYKKGVGEIVDGALIYHKRMV
jgi:uncharacterized protein YihD (DUF1040 family)